MSSRLFVMGCLVLVGCSTPMPPPPEPGPLLAGVATRKLDVPVGIAMGGYSRTRPADDPRSPWSKQLPASRGIHTEPTVRVIALSNGLTKVAFIRMDTTLISSTLRARTMAALEALGESTRVFMHASHSHASPARIMPPARLGGPTGSDFVSLVMDHYDAEVEAMMVFAIVEATREAYANLRPVSVGVAHIDGAAFNNDRRCENDPVYGAEFRDTDFTLVRFDVVDASGAPTEPLTAMVQYAMHGTMLGSDNTLLSSEVTGAVELYASRAIGVPVMFVQGAGGDVSPRSSPYGHEALQNIERQGRAAAAVVKLGFANAAPGAAKAQSRLDFTERGVLLTREAMGYAKDEFPEWGGISCAAGGMGAFCGEVKSTPAQVMCLPLEPRPAFKTALTLVQLDDLVFLSTPGELGTGLSRKLREALAPLGATTTLPVGYAQDHYGYLLEEDDWLRGGYEPTVSAYGWKFGPYLLAEVQQLVATLGQEQPKPDVAPLPEVVTRARTDSTGPAVVITEPDAGPRLTTHVFAFEGGDPGLGTPQVSLELSGTAVGGYGGAINGPEILLRYDATPTFRADDDATVRKHVWTALFETVPDAPLTTYRFVARGRIKLAGEVSDYTLTSAPFEVTASEAIGNAQLRFTDDGRLALTARFPPNPMELTPTSVRHYRVRDLDSDPREGALASGTTVEVTLTTPSARGPATLTWSDTEKAWLSSPQSETGTYTVEAAAGTLSDLWRNVNGAAQTVSATR